MNLASMKEYRKSDQSNGFVVSDIKPNREGAGKR